MTCKILNNPFYYSPDSRCVEAAKEVIADIETHEAWREEMAKGKMFGVLIHKDGYLKAYSGQILGRGDWEGYVPLVHDYLQPDGYFKTEEANIVEINHTIATLESEKKAAPEAWQKQQETQLRQLKEERKRRSIALQRWLFEQFHMLNARGEENSLVEIFEEWSARVGSKCTVPSSGSGECCAPKLLQYAFKHGIKPLAIGEFWVCLEERGGLREERGKRREERGVRRVHGQFYGACMSRCKPILEWMLQGIDYEANPLDEQDETTELTVLYEDDRIIAVDKPAGMLSVPGKSQRRSAYDILKLMRPDCNALMMVHRLDMQTSGILVAAKDLDTYREIQRYILAETTLEEAETTGWQKEYIAELERELPYPIGWKGVIDLPLSADYLNRPMQRVDYENGKRAVTHYEVIGTCNGHTVLKLHPLTGRTHQLRVHCAHPDGLGIPILGDDLYGTHADRLHLHARKLQVGGITIVSPTN